MTIKTSHASCYHTSYRLTCAEYDDLLRLAQGCCKICKEPTETFYIDHDHALGDWAVRGLLCNGCNLRLAKVESGKHEKTAAVARYLANAWHRRQASSAIKAARVRSRVECPSCGRFTSVYSTGRLHRHYLRVQPYELCPGSGVQTGRIGTQPPTS
ncbi:endonuclease domain-containing protein [Streptomyces canus]|uniref:endonuclease domain-containing protein n=1 Tax=Streptomyces canus TaxID=58343 RepID=UPI0037F3BED2